MDMPTNPRVVAAFAALALPAAAQQSPWIAMIPDTQHYTVDPAGRMPHFRDLVLHLCLWRPDFVTHVGDLTQNAAVPEFQQAMGAMSPLDAFRIPYRISPGNHDYESGRKPLLTTFQQFVGATPSHFEHPAFLAINVGWLPSDAEIEWARGLMDARPHKPVLLTTHEWLLRGDPAPRSTYGSNKDGDGDNSAEDAWQKLVVPYPQVVMVLCGHTHGEGVRSEVTPLGATVHQVLFNTQDDPYGGQGFMRLIGFLPQYIGVWTLSMTRTSLPPDRTGFFALSNNFASFPPVFHARTGQDTFVIPVWPGTVRGTHDQVTAAAAGAFEKGLLRFDLPAAATTCSRALLTLTVEGYAADGGGFGLHTMRRGWSENDSWSTLGGLVVGVDADPVPAATVGAIGKGTISLDVTGSVQAWLAGRANHGWLVDAAGDSTSFRSFDWRAASERPLLTIVP
jgi:hypothetical protein